MLCKSQRYLGSIRVTLDQSGNVDSWTDYYPFGKQSRGSSSVSAPKEKFTGKERDAESGLDYFGARYYNSEVARWLAVDPMGKKYPSVSPYNYVLNNPVNAYDPDGKDVEVHKDSKVLKAVINDYYSRSQTFRAVYELVRNNHNIRAILYADAFTKSSKYDGTTVYKGTIKGQRTWHSTILANGNTFSTRGQYIAHELLHVIEQQNMYSPSHFKETYLKILKEIREGYSVSEDVFETNLADEVESQVETESLSANTSDDIPLVNVADDVYQDDEEASLMDEGAKNAQKRVKKRLSDIEQRVKEKNEEK
ncbi:MAG: RHS repeat-associated core domain-containing protein [Cyclobacteriaceae bacterium]|nr:RHS repeat-associated core domain-containing protein [Cyclobacteriaceae bacterium]